MDNKVKKYIKENLDLIDDLNITTFYEKAMYGNQLKGIQIGDITSALYLSGIDPTKYLNTLFTYMFCGVTGLNEVIIPSNIDIIEMYAFKHSDVKTINISEGCTRIETEAFAYAKNVERIIIPTSVIDIGEMVFDATPSNLTVNYLGTGQQFKSINTGASWLLGSNVTEVYCADKVINVC